VGFFDAGRKKRLTVGCEVSAKLHDFLLAKLNCFGWGDVHAPLIVPASPTSYEAK